jgi:hypothetical protein
MAYRVVYHPDRKEPEKSGGSGFRITLFTLIFLGFFVVIVNCCWPAGRERLQYLFIPEESKAAVHELVDDLKHGESLADAVQVFCETVIENAGVADEYEDPN